jgi:hypothetical protein
MIFVLFITFLARMIYGNLSLILVGYLELWSTKWGAHDVPWVCRNKFISKYIFVMRDFIFTDIRVHDQKSGDL